MTGKSAFCNCPIYKEIQPPEVVFKKAGFKNFAIFIEKHMCWPATSLKRHSNTGFFL